MSGLFIAVLIIAAVLVLAWNVIPSVRERMRGWTTIAEAGIAAGMPFIGSAIDAFQETNWQAFIPNNAWPYILASLAGWFVFKRVATNTSVGKTA